MTSPSNDTKRSEITHPYSLKGIAIVHARYGGIDNNVAYDAMSSRLVHR